MELQTGGINLPVFRKKGLQKKIAEWLGGKVSGLLLSLEEIHSTISQDNVQMGLFAQVGGAYKGIYSYKIRRVNEDIRMMS